MIAMHVDSPCVFARQRCHICKHGNGGVGQRWRARARRRRPTVQRFPERGLTRCVSRLGRSAARALQSTRRPTTFPHAGPATRLVTSRPRRLLHVLCAQPAGARTPSIKRCDVGGLVQAGYGRNISYPKVAESCAPRVLESYPDEPGMLRSCPKDAQSCRTVAPEAEIRASLANMWPKSGKIARNWQHFGILWSSSVRM